jgi:hypothetical protein
MIIRPNALYHKMFRLSYPPHNDEEIISKICFNGFTRSISLVMKTSLINSIIAIGTTCATTFFVVNLAFTPSVLANSVREELDRTNRLLNDTQRFLDGQERERNRRVTHLNALCQTA